MHSMQQHYPQIMTGPGKKSITERCKTEEGRERWSCCSEQQAEGKVLFFIVSHSTNYAEGIKVNQLQLTYLCHLGFTTTRLL